VGLYEGFLSAGVLCAERSEADLVFLLWEGVQDLGGCSFYGHDFWQGWDPFYTGGELIQGLNSGFCLLGAFKVWSGRGNVPLYCKIDDATGAQKFPSNLTSMVYSMNR
jgi:hypothetical protein